MISYYRQVLHYLIPVFLWQVQEPIIWDDDEARIKWTDLFKNYSLEQEVYILGGL